ncbi:hypothetical protein JW877_06260 [bacterium]|nr:hypothetical protein [bacterium]
MNYKKVALKLGIYAAIVVIIISAAMIISNLNSPEYHWKYFLLGGLLVLLGISEIIENSRGKVWIKQRFIKKPSQLVGWCLFLLILSIVNLDLKPGEQYSIQQLLFSLNLVVIGVVGIIQSRFVVQAEKKKALVFSERGYLIETIISIPVILLALFMVITSLTHKNTDFSYFIWGLFFIMTGVMGFIQGYRKKSLPGITPLKKPKHFTNAGITLLIFAMLVILGFLTSSIKAPRWVSIQDILFVIIMLLYGIHFLIISKQFKAFIEVKTDNPS